MPLPDPKYVQGKVAQLLRDCGLSAAVPLPPAVRAALDRAAVSFQDAVAEALRHKHNAAAARTPLQEAAEEGFDLGGSK